MITSAEEARKIIFGYEEAQRISHGQVILNSIREKELNEAYAWIECLKGKEVVALVEELESLEVYKELSNDGIKALAQYKEAIATPNPFQP